MLAPSFSRLPPASVIKTGRRSRSPSSATSFGFGISYVFGEIESIDEGEDEELVITLADPEEGAFAAVFTLYEDGIFYPTSAVSRDQFQMSLDYEFNFGNPLGEEE